jgi:periplasmic copper chaperone A
MAEGQNIQIESPWSRATAPGAKIAAGYMMIRNHSALPDRLIGAASPLAAKVETHLTMRDGEIMRMREVRGYDVPANGSFELKPGGAHLMFVEIKRPFKEGDRIPATLRFQKAGEIKVEFQVVSLSGPPPHRH